jgi:hypothetical protein
LVDYLGQKAHYPAVLVAFLASHMIETIRPSHICNAEWMPAFPPRLLPSMASNFSLGLLHLHVRGLPITDDFLVALAESKASSSLKTLAVSAEFLTAKSDSLWCRLPALEKLQMSSLHRFTIQTADAIGKHPKLQEIEIRASHMSEDYCDILEAFLSSERLPELRSLTLGVPRKSYSKALSKLVRLLDARSSNHLLECLELGINTAPRDPDADADAEAEENVDTFERILSIHQRCPNLRHLFGTSFFDIPKVDITKDMKHFQNLSDLFFIDLLTCSLEEAALFFPNIVSISQQIRLREGLSPTRLDMFSSVKRVNLTMRKFALISLYPPLLKELTLKVEPDDTSETVPTDQTSLLFQTLFQQSPELHYLSVTLPGESLQDEHVKQVLLSFQRLTSLTLHNARCERAKPITRHISFSHPHLYGLPTIGITGLGLTPIWLPELDFVILQPRDMHLVKNLVAPSLGLIRMSYSDDGAMEALLDSAPLIEMLHLKNAEISDAIAIVSKVCQFKSISSFILRGFDANITASVLSTLLQGLPWLGMLEANVHLGSQAPKGWLKHPRLSSLELTFCDTDDEPCSDFQELLLSPETLPALRWVTMGGSCGIERLVVEDLPLMTHLEMTSKVPFKLSDVAIQRCKALREAEIACFYLGDLVLRQLPSLDTLKVTLFFDTEETTHIEVTDLPPLRVLIASLRNGTELLWEQKLLSKLESHPGASPSINFKNLS